MIIRNIEERDLKEIIELIKICTPYVIPHHFYNYWLLNNYFHSTCFVAESEGEIVGFISSMPSIDKSALFIWQICTRPGYQKQGIGMQLLDNVYKRSKELNYSSLHFSIAEKNDASKNLFTKFAHKKNLTITELNKQDFITFTEVIFKIE